MKIKLPNWHYNFYPKLRLFWLFAAIMHLVFYFILSSYWSFYDNFSLRFISFLLGVGHFFFPSTNNYKIGHKIFIEVMHFVALPLVFSINMIGNIIAQDSNLFGVAYWIASMIFCGFIYGLLSYQLISLPLYFSFAAIIMIYSLGEDVPMNLILLAYLGGSVSLLISASIRLMFESYFNRDQTFIKSAVELNKKMTTYMLSDKGENSYVATGDEINQMHNIFEDLKAHISELLRTEKKLSKYKAIGQTTEFLAHDIKKPFSQLKLVLGLMRNKDSNSISVNKYLPAIEALAQKVNHLLSDIMNFGSSIKLNLKLCSIKNLVFESLKSEIGVYANRKVRLVYRFEHLNCVEVDPIKISRVFSNILHNAIEETPDEGVIRFSSSQISSKRVLIRISNTGSYIPKHKIESLFDPFVTNKELGTGLGLAISKEIVESHQGQITCESNKSEGTSFSFDLPSSDTIDTYSNTFPENVSEIRF